MNVPTDPAAAAAAAREKEYYFIEELISSINSDCLEIKKWSVTTASAVAVAGQLTGTSVTVQLLIIASLALAFWLTETQWRINQWSFIRRVQELEAADRAGPQVSSGWVRHYRGKAFYDRYLAKPAEHWLDPRGESELGRRISHFFELRTSLPHILVVAIAGTALVYFTLWVTPEAPKPALQQLSGSVSVELKPAPNPGPAGAVK